jgi:hypothetical protein
LVWRKEETVIETVGMLERLSVTAGGGNQKEGLNLQANCGALFVSLFSFPGHHLLQIQTTSPNLHEVSLAAVTQSMGSLCCDQVTISSIYTIVPKS